MPEARSRSASATQRRPRRGCFSATTHSALLRLAIADDGAAEQAIQTLMGKDVEPRFKLIMERAPKIDDVDV